MKITTMLPGGGKRCETDIRIKITVGDFLRGNFTGRDFNFFPRLSGDLQEEEQKIRRRCSMTQLQNNTIKKKRKSQKANESFGSSVTDYASLSNRTKKIEANGF